jgi:hypothetical protein
MAAPALATERYQFRDDGIVLNEDPATPFVDVTKVQGLDAAPLRLTTKDHEGRLTQILQQWIPIWIS